MAMASQGQIFMQRVHPVQRSALTSQTMRVVGIVGSSEAFPMQSSWGMTAMQASQPVQRSGLMSAMVRDFRVCVGVAMGSQFTRGTAPRQLTPGLRQAKMPPMPKRTYQPHKRRRAKTIGFRARMATPGGRRVIKRRRQKGRWKLTK